MGIAEKAFDPIGKTGIEKTLDRTGKISGFRKRPPGKSNLFSGESHRFQIETPLFEVGGGKVGSKRFRGHDVETFGSSPIQEKVVENANFWFGHIGPGGILWRESYPMKFLCKERILKNITKN